MSSLIGQLRIALQLDSVGFERGTKRASAEVDAFGSRAEKAGFRLGQMGKAVVAGGALLASSAIASKIKDMVTQGLAYASALEEQAQQLGVTASALQEYRYAASQVGISNEEMDSSLAQLTKRIGAAGEGAKGPAAAFEKLGINIRDARGHLLDAGTAIPLIAEALSKIPDPAQRAALEVQLFGKAGQKLDTLLSQGAAGVNNLRDAAHKLGIVLSDEQIQKADATADKLNAVKQVLEARVAAVVSDNADSILRLADGFAKLVDNGIKLMNMLNALANSPGGKFLAKLNSAAAYANPLALQLKALGYASDALGSADKPASAPRSSGPTPRITDQVRPAYGPLNPAFMKGYTRSQLRTGGSGNLFNGNSLGSSPFAGFEPGLIKQGLAEISEGMDDAGDHADKLARRSRVAGDEMNRSFSDAANGILSSLDRLSGAFQGGSFLDKLGAIIGLGLQLGSVGLFGKTAQTNINSSSLPGRASGGPVSGGKLYMVGERGPEIFASKSGGRIIPNHALGGGRQVVEIVDTTGLFRFAVNGQIMAAAPAIASAGGEVGVRRMQYRNSRRVA